MNIQPISAFTTNSNVKTSKKQNQLPQVAFRANDNVDKSKLNNALKALALASTVAFAPVGMTSCDKEHFCDEYCDHPNHIDPPNWGQGGENQKDTITTGDNYTLPEVSMKRYKIENGDTINIGKVKFSESVVHIPYNAHKSSELKTYMNFIDAMGLSATTVGNVFVPTRSFEYNAVPAQITWLDEKTGAVNQLKLNGFEKDKNKVQMDLISILADNKAIERKLELTSVAANKLIINSFTKDGNEKIGSSLVSLDNGVITQFSANEDGTYTRKFEFTKNTDNSINATNRNGEKSKLANIHTIVALAQDIEEIDENL